MLVFFVLSGFLVGGQVIRAVRAGRFRSGGYGIDRATRILLPLIPACLLTAAIGTVIGDSPSIEQLVGAIAGLNGVIVPNIKLNDALWTLSYEIWFYILAGAVGCLFLRKGGVVAIILLLASAMVFGVHDARFLLVWVLGALAILLVDNMPRKRPGGARAAHRTRRVGVLATRLAKPILHQYRAAPASSGRADDRSWRGADAALARDARVGCNTDQLAGIASHVSAASYTLYLVHEPVITAFNETIPPRRVSMLRA